MCCHHCGRSMGPGFPRVAQRPRFPHSHICKLSSKGRPRPHAVLSMQAEICPTVAVLSRWTKLRPCGVVAQSVCCPLVRSRVSSLAFYFRDKPAERDASTHGAVHGRRPALPASMIFLIDGNRAPHSSVVHLYFTITGPADRFRRECGHGSTIWSYKFPLTGSSNSAQWSTPLPVHS